MESNNKLCTSCTDQGYKVEGDMCIYDEKEEKDNKLSGGAIAGIIIASIVVICAVVILSVYCIKHKKSDKKERDIQMNNRDKNVIENA